MDALSHIASSFIADHRAWAGLALGLAAFGESLVVIGAFLPATVLLVAAGGLIATGALDGAQVILWSSLGAIAGDALSFALGRRLGSKTLEHPLLAKHGRLIAQTRLLTQRYGVASLFIGRFAGPLRAFVPVMAGMMRMPRHSFHLANILSGLVWVAAFLTPGYLAAKGLAHIDGATLAKAAVILLGVLALGAMAWASRRLFRAARPQSLPHLGCC